MTARTENRLVFWAFLTPILITFLIVVIVPFLVGIYYAFTDWNAIPGTPTTVVGLANFQEVFSDDELRQSMLATVLFTVYAVLLINIVGFLLALLVTRPYRSANYMRTVFFMPNLIGGLILGFIWRFVFLKISPALHDFLGLSTIDWLGNANSALFAMAIVSTWQMGGYIMIIYIASIVAIPASLIEASEIDGVNNFQKTRHIIFPMVAPAFTASLFLYTAIFFTRSRQRILTMSSVSKCCTTTLVMFSRYAYLHHQHSITPGTLR